MSTHRSLLRVLRHPLWIASLALLIANDHFLKGSGLLPGWITGKLSDVAGMLVAPALLALLLVLARVRRERAIPLAHLAVGVGFAALEVSPALSARLDALYQVFGRRWVSTSDWSDLLALAILPLSYAFVRRISAAEPAAREPGRRRPLELALAVAGLTASVATTESSDPVPPCDPEETVDCDMDGVGIPQDCNDFDSTINPNAGNCPGSGNEESCDNGLDDNGDNQIDCDDEQCIEACADSNAVCSAPPALTLGDFSASTLTGSWALEGSCGGADAPEKVFTFQAPGTGMLLIDVPEGHVVYARRQCAQALDEIDCVSSEDLARGETVATLLLQVSAYDQLSVVFDAIDGLSAAAFSTRVSFIPVGCGDLDIDSANGEECDDGNLDSGDGCSESCISEASQVCNNALYLDDVIGNPGAIDFSEATTFFSSACSDDLDGKLAPERVFEFLAPSSGVLTVTASMVDSPLSIFVESECGGASIACAPYGAAGEPTDLAVPLALGAYVFVFIEGTPESPLDADVTVSAEFVPD